MKGEFFPSRTEILEKPQITIKTKKKLGPFRNSEFQTFTLRFEMQRFKRPNLICSF